MSAKRILPIHEYLPTIQKFLNSRDKFCLISGTTGSGKSTEIPKLLLNQNPSHSKNNRFFTSNRQIVIIQPRRIAVINLYKYLKPLLGVDLGYCIRFEKENSTSAKIVIMTDGYLLKTLSRKNFLSKYSIFIVDEVHERTISTELLLGILKAKSKEIEKVILMSASITSKESIFSKFFESLVVFNIKNQIFPVETLYLESPTNNYMKSIKKIIIRITKESSTVRKILIFLPGKESINLLENTIRKKINSTKIVKLHSGINSLDNDNTLDTTIILATNIAESSITIDGVTDVIDSGLVKKKFFLLNTFTETIKLLRTSKQEAIQRAGRTGRTGPGRCHCLYTKEEADNMVATPPSQVVEGNPLDYILKIFEEGHRPAKFPFLLKPSKESLSKGMVILLRNKLIDKDSGRMTERGKNVAKIPLPVDLATCLVLCIEERDRFKDNYLLFKQVSHVILCLLSMLVGDENTCKEIGRSKGCSKSGKGYFYWCALAMYKYIGKGEIGIDEGILKNNFKVYDQLFNAFKNCSKFKGSKTLLAELVMEEEEFNMVFEYCLGFIIRGMPDNICEVVGKNKLKSLKNDFIIYTDEMDVEVSKGEKEYGVFYSLFFDKRCFASFVEVVSEDVLIEHGGNNFKKYE